MMEKTALRLRILFFATLLVVGIIVVLFETGILSEGMCALDKRMEYFAAVIVELFTLIAVPLALRLFKFGAVRRRLFEDKEHALAIWGTIRILILGLPMVMSALLYYLFLNASFGYIAIILLISMLFIYPSMERCVSETTAPKND